MARSILMAAAEEERMKRYSNINRRMIREASKLLMLPEKEFVGHYRLHKSHFETLCEDVIPLLPETQRTSAVRPEKDDSGYAQRPWLMTPIVNAAPNSPEELYTRKHISARNVVERCIGVLKTLWRCLLAQKSGCIGMQAGRCAWPRGRVVGGSSVLHSMMHTRGNRKDYDRWAANGNPGWDYKSVLRYFKRSEKMQIPELARNNKYHSTRGEMTLQYPNWRTSLSEAFLKAGVETGGRVVDYNGAKQTGYSIIQFTMKNGTRMSASKAFLHPIKSRRNFHITKRAMVTRILIDPWKKTAYGVKFTKGDKKYKVIAKKEVIVSAGSINSPQLLMISGIGPRDHLTDKNITTILDLPVGYNLQDHWALGGLTFTINTTDSIRAERVVSFHNVIEYFSHHTGPLSAPSGTEALAFIDTRNPDSDNGYPDLELLFVGGSLVSQPAYQKAFSIDDQVYEQVYGPISDRDTWMVFPMLLLPKSRGRIMLKDKNPYRKPLIQANYFTDDGHDQKVILYGIRKVIELSKTKAFQKYGSKLHDIPLPQCANHRFNSDRYWFCAMKTITNTIYHHCCTNKMGPRDDPEAVVDSRLRVHGLHGLRVVDASVMPHVPAAHTNAPTMMLAEKAADMIKEDWGV